MTKPKPPMSPTEFHELPTTAKKVHALTLLYMNRCVEGGFSRKSLFPLKRYFGSKVDPKYLQVFFDYLSSLKEPTVVSLYDLYALSESHQGQLRLNSGDQEETVEAYESLLSHLGKL